MPTKNATKSPAAGPDTDSTLFGIPIVIPPIAVNYKDAARALGMSVTRVRKLVWSGKLKPLNDGGKTHVFLYDDVRRLAFELAGRKAA